MKKRDNTIILLGVLIMLVGVSIIGCGGERVENKKIVELVREDLADSLGVPQDSISVKSIEQVEWNDAGLGVPSGMAAQVITPGYIIYLEYDGMVYKYHTDTRESFIRVEKT